MADQTESLINRGVACFGQKRREFGPIVVAAKKITVLVKK